MKKYNCLIRFCLLTLFLLAPSIAGTLTSFEPEPFDTAPYAVDFEYFTIGSGSFLAQANYSGGDSVIYKWDGSAYSLYQTFPATNATDWEFFTLGTEAYLALANHDRNSMIYQWDTTGDGNGGVGTGAFEVYQTIPTKCAYRLEYFTIGTDSFLAAANLRDGGNYVVDSVIYKWDTNEQFSAHQNIATFGANDLKFFTISTDAYLVVPNYSDGTTRNIDSILYRWNGHLFEEYQAIPTHGAQDCEFFTLGGDSFLAVANYHNDNSYSIDSEIYRWDGTAFVAFQSIPTNGGHDWKFFTIANEDYLVVVNYHGNNVQVFKYDGDIFTIFQNIATSNAPTCTLFTRDSDLYLAIPNYYDGTSNLYKATLTPDPTATLHEVTPCPGQSVTLSQDVWGDQPITYQWQFYGEDIAGATDDSYTIPAMGLSDEGIYECVLTNASGTGLSNALTLTQNPAILLEDPPNDISSCQGETVTFALTASGHHLRYQWAFNGTSILGAIQPSYTLENITTANEGTYTCTLSDACTTQTTEPVSLSVSTSEWIELGLPANLNLEGEQVTLPISLSGLNDSLIQAFSFSLSFDSSLLTFDSHRTAGTLTENWLVHSNATATTLVISGSHGEPLTGDGDLIKLVFDVMDTTSGGCGEITLDHGLLNEGEYCVAPVTESFCVCLKGDATQNGNITALDATQILRHMVGTPTTPNELALCNADTTCNGSIAPLDAVRIMEYSVGRIDSFCSTGASSWTEDVSVSIPDLTLSANDPLTIPLVLGDTTGLEIKGLAFTLEYDPERLDITGLDPTGSLLADVDWQYEINSSEPGQVRVAAAGFTALSGSGILLNLHGTVRHWGQTELAVTQLVFNEGMPRAVLSETPSKFTILGFGIEPPAVALGLEPPQLEIVEVCCGELELEWRDPALDLVLPGNPLILNPAPQHSSVFEARISHPITQQSVLKRAQVLVAEPPFPLDYNGDGFNSLEDLFLLLPDWGQPLAPDPNGDGFVDIRDFLFINVMN